MSELMVMGANTADGLDTAIKYAQLFVDSKLFTDVPQLAQAAVKVIAGAELGLSPFASMNGIHIIKGKTCLSAQLMGMIVKRSGRYDYKVLEHSDTICKIEFHQIFAGEWVVAGISEFTMDMATKAGLMSNENYRKYPRNMLFARAMSNGAKWYCADVFAGPIYTPEEMDEVKEARAVRVPSGGVKSTPALPSAPVHREEAVVDNLAGLDLKALTKLLKKQASDAGWEIPSTDMAKDWISGLLGMSIRRIELTEETMRAALRMPESRVLQVASQLLQAKSVSEPAPEPADELELTGEPTVREKVRDVAERAGITLLNTEDLQKWCAFLTDVEQPATLDDEYLSRCLAADAKRIGLAVEQWEAAE